MPFDVVDRNDGLLERVAERARSLHTDGERGLEAGADGNSNGIELSEWCVAFCDCGFG